MKYQPNQLTSLLVNETRENSAGEFLLRTVSKTTRTLTKTDLNLIICF